MTESRDLTFVLRDRSYCKIIKMYCVRERRDETVRAGVAPVAIGKLVDLYKGNGGARVRWFVIRAKAYVQYQRAVTAAASAVAEDLRT